MAHQGSRYASCIDYNNYIDALRFGAFLATILAARVVYGQCIDLRTVVEVIISSTTSPLVSVGVSWFHTNFTFSMRDASHVDADSERGHPDESTLQGLWAHSRGTRYLV